MWVRWFAGLVAASALAALAVPGCLGVGDASGNEPHKDAGSDHDAAALSDGSWICTPKTCQSLKADCGDTSDGCGKVISCGSCPSGQTCGAGGPNRCGTGTCTASTCASTSAECGLIGDGCGKTLDCGSCAAPAQCGAGGQPNQCSCVPTTCAAQGKECGTISDGCGGSLACGSCPSGKSCGAGGVPNICGCVPTTCAAENKNCGSLPDNCGGTLNCGSCIAPSTCGAFTPNLCGCTPQNCPPVYQNSFETTSDFPTGWVTWQNCPVDSSWYVKRDPVPAPSGGSWGLSMHSTGFTTAGCQFPGVYADSPPVPALPGRVYKVQVWSQNGSNPGATTLIFFDSASTEIGSQQASWTNDSGQYKADPLVTATSPAGTASLSVRLELWAASTTAEVDLLQVDLQPL